MVKILIVEDESDIRSIIRKFLETEGYKVDEADTITEMRKKLSVEDYDVILLDLMLPDGDGTTEIPNIRSSHRNTGIIVVSAKDSDMDRIFGIELGADDYITKPFNPREIVARVRAVLRRLKNEKDCMRFGELEIYPKDYVVKVNGRVVNMSTTEFKILRLLASSPNRVFSRNEILDYVWGDDEFVSDRVVDVHISAIRNKIGKDRIKTVRGVGYKFTLKGESS